MIKELTLLRYFTSEIRHTRAQRYAESLERYDPCLPYTASQRALATPNRSAAYSMEAEMAESRSARGPIGQQAGSKRPAPRTGAAKVAPKKGTIEPKGTRRPGLRGRLARAKPAVVVR